MIYYTDSIYFVFLYVSINVKKSFIPSLSLVFQYVLEFVSILRELKKPKYAHRCAVPCHSSRILAEKE